MRAVRWLGDWRNIAALVAAALVGMLLIGYLAALSDREHFIHQLQDKKGETSILTTKVDGLKAELEQVLAANSDAERAAVVQRFEQQRAAAATPKPAVTRSTSTTRTRPTSTSSPKPTSTSSPPTTASTSTTTTTAPRCRRLAGVVCVKPITVP